MNTASVISKWEEPKFSDEEQFYTFDWADRLGEGETIVGTPKADGLGGITVISHAMQGTISRLKLGKGTVGDRAGVHMLATTSADQKVGVTVLLDIVPI